MRYAGICALRRRQEGGDVQNLAGEGETEQRLSLNVYLLLMLNRDTPMSGLFNLQHYGHPRNGDRCRDGGGRDQLL